MTTNPKLVVAALAALSLTTTGRAAADDAAGGPLSAAVLVDLFPVGSFHVEIPGFFSQDSSTAFAYGLALHAELALTPVISVGVAPRYILNVITEHANPGTDPASELDLLARVQLNHAVDAETKVFGFGALGYSFLNAPDGNSEDSEGLAIGFGAGGRRAMGGRLFAQGEVGYQLGAQKVSGNGITSAISTNYLHLGIGVGSTF